MNQFIKEQLDKCVGVDIEQTDTNTFLIHKKSSDIPTDLQQNHYYIIEVEDYIIHPFEGFTLHDNWNNGNVPTNKNMQIYVTQIMGKMVKVESKGCDDGLIWVGWLPRKSIHIKQVIA